MSKLPIFGLFPVSNLKLILRRIFKRFFSPLDPTPGRWADPEDTVQPNELLTETSGRKQNIQTEGMPHIVRINIVRLPRISSHLPVPFFFLLQYRVVHQVEEDLLLTLK